MGDLYCCASSNLLIDLYVTNVVLLYIHNCSQDSVRYFSANVKDCEYFVTFYVSCTNSLMMASL